jgi:predicted MFS family arabinose efflux permease
MTGIGLSLTFPSFGVEAVKQVFAADRGSALGVHVTFFDLGFALAAPITGLIAGAFDYSSVLTLGAVGAVVAVFFAFCTAKNRSVASAK